MTDDPVVPTFDSFDLPPEEFRRLGYRVVDLMLDQLATERDGPVYPSVSGPELRALLDAPLPEHGVDPDAVIDSWRDRVAPYCRRNGHPRFFGYVCTSADPLAMLADAMASAMNQPVTAWRSAPAATEVERLAVRWLDALVRFEAGDEGTGLLVSGGSSANLHGLAAAVSRVERAGRGPGRRHELTAYLTAEAHLSLRKALRLLGLHPDHVRLVPTDDRRRMRPEALNEMLQADADAGLTRAVVCGSAGTANTGTIDPLDEIAAICEEAGVWFHIDGSYGAPAVMTEEYGWMAGPFGRADSLALDPHKWLFAPVDAGCILFRRDDDARQAFAWHSEYTEVTQTDPIEQYALFDRGIEMSRRFRGLKVWSILRVRGRERLCAAIAHDIALRRRLDARIAAESRLEPLGSALSITCFRYRPEGVKDEPGLNALNRRIVEALVGEGQCYLSPTTLDGRFALRVCIVNFRTQDADVDFLIDEILRLGERVRLQSPVEEGR